MRSPRTELVRAVGRILRSAIADLPERVTPDPVLRERIQEEIEGVTRAVAIRLRDEAPGLLQAANMNAGADSEGDRGQPGNESTMPAPAGSKGSIVQAATPVMQGGTDAPSRIPGTNSRRSS